LKKLPVFAIVIIVVTSLAIWKTLSSPSSEVKNADLPKDDREEKRNKEAVSATNERIIVIDFGLPSYKKRLWVKEGKKVLLNTYVTHGKMSGLIYTTEFSNELGSNMSCYGRFKTSEVYIGKHGLSMRVIGLNHSNSNALKRDIVFHAAEYATEKWLRKYGKLGRSQGCFATSTKDNLKIIQLAKERGSIDVYVFR
jgi:hypothetical protein